MYSYSTIDKIFVHILRNIDKPIKFPFLKEDKNVKSPNGHVLYDRITNKLLFSRRIVVETVLLKVQSSSITKINIKGL